MANFVEKTSKWAIIAVSFALLISISSKKVDGKTMAPTMAPVMAPTMAPGPSSGGGLASECMTAVYNMSDCLSYVSKGSTVSKPDKPCCPELAGLVESNPVCLCLLFGNSKDMPIELDMSRALKLPKVCGVVTPPVSMCSAVIGAPVGVPIGAPVGSPSSSEGPSSSSPGGMSPMAAEPSAGKNGASSSNAYLSVVVYIVAALALALSSFSF